MEFYAQSFSSKLQAFNLIPIAYMANIMAKMNVRLYYTGQIIFGPNEKRGILRCIYIGTAAVYSSTGKEVCTALLIMLPIFKNNLLINCFTM